MSNKDLKYYKNLEYNIIVEKQLMNGESWYIAYTNELGKFACFGRGESQAESVKSFLEEKEVFIEYLYNEGKNIPEPKNEDVLKFSGFFNVRTSPNIHANLVYQAKQMDISLNLYLNQLLSAATAIKSNENIIMNKLSEISSNLNAHHFEVTRKLNYKAKSISKKTQNLFEDYLISA